MVLLQTVQKYLPSFCKANPPPAPEIVPVDKNNPCHSLLGNTPFIKLEAAFEHCMIFPSDIGIYFLKYFVQFSYFSDFQIFCK